MTRACTVTAWRREGELYRRRWVRGEQSGVAAGSVWRLCNGGPWMWRVTGPDGSTGGSTTSCEEAKATADGVLYVRLRRHGAKSECAVDYVAAVRRLCPPYARLVYWCARAGVVHARAGGGPRGEATRRAVARRLQCYMLVFASRGHAPVYDVDGRVRA